MAVLTVKNIHKHYEGAPLLTSLSFEVNSGEILCLLGRSGSGKSTLLRIIAGIEKAEKGEILWNGTNLANVPTHLRNFSLMFQDYALFPHKNVAENVAFGLEMKHVPPTEIKKLVSEALERVNMADFARRSVADLSGGEQQRVALARALAAKPRLLMLDEPLAALDRSLRLELQEELRTLLHQAELPVIYVTHDQEEAVILGDRLAILHNGGIEQIGAADELFNAPKTRWVAEFLGHTNFVPGEIVSHQPLTIRTPLGDFSPELSVEPLLAIGAKATVLIKKFGAQLIQTQPNVNHVSGSVRVCAFREDGYRVNLECGLTEELIFTLPKPVQAGSIVNLEIPSSNLVILPQ